MTQTIEALTKGNEVRMARAALKRAILAGEVLAAEVLLTTPPDWLEGMRVEQLILAIRRFPQRIYRREMHASHTRLTARVGDLTDRKRRVLAERIGEWECCRLEGRRVRS